MNPRHLRNRNGRARARRDGEILERGEPKTLLEQLKPNGVLVAPIGKGPVQHLKRYAGDGAGGFKVEILCEVRFVPLLDGVAKEL